MDDDAVDDLLRSAGWGVVSLADADEPYSVPISFGYDGEDVYFGFLRTGGGSRKAEYVADGKTARLLVTDVRARFDWRSVAVTGPVQAVDWNGDGWETLVDLLEENPWFSSQFTDADRVEGVQGWQLRPDEVSGLAIRPDRE
jgi:nitroimidazol reductase NimA-like FMN-containing flavoprotein (pyridoxamine 5'-phosphate oxidase superfamily)